MSETHVFPMTRELEEQADEGEIYLPVRAVRALVLKGFEVTQIVFKNTQDEPNETITMNLVDLADLLGVE